MNNIDKIFEDWDEDETLYQDWKLIKISSGYYIITDIISDIDIILHDNYRYTTNQFDKKLSIDETREIIKKNKYVNFNLHIAGHCKFSELPEKIKEKIKC